MALQKPNAVLANDAMSAKWDELTADHEFNPSDVPTLILLTQWYAVLDTCVEDINVSGQIQVAYQNNLGDLKSLPQIAIMKQASAEIRALNKQLGINDVSKPQEKPKETPLNVIKLSREKRVAKATNTA